MNTMSWYAVRDQWAVAAMMGVSLTRVQQLEAKAIRKLEIALSARGYANETTIQAAAK